MSKLIIVNKFGTKAVFGSFDSEQEALDKIMANDEYKKLYKKATIEIVTEQRALEIQKANSLEEDFIPSQELIDAVSEILAISRRLNSSVIYFMDNKVSKRDARSRTVKAREALKKMDNLLKLVTNGLDI